MKRLLSLFAIVLVLPLTSAQAQSVGSAAGSGLIERLIPGDPSGGSEQLAFSPHYSFAYTEGTGDRKSTWIVLTEKEPPLQTLLAAADRVEARRSWCEKEKASFVALKLDSKWAVDLYFICPGNGGVNTEMLSTINGLDSIIVNFDVKNDSRLKGSLIGGEGSCPDAQGNNAYCTKKSDYTFDAPIIK